MIQRILIPLDGSELSDRVLMDVRRLLLGLDDVELQLLEVVQPSPHAPAAGVGEFDSAPSPIQLRMENARRHLNRVGDVLEREGVRVVRTVRMGDPGEEILRAIRRLQPDLLAMATHGRSGISRWVRGSVAERLLRRSPVPVFLCNPEREAGHPTGTTFRRILVTLDGSEMASRVLPLVEAFARRYGAEILLLRVVGSPVVIAAEGSYMLPPAAYMTAAEGAASLQPHARRLEAAGLPVRVLGAMGDTASEILRVLVDEDVDMLAMTTHGYTGVDRWLFGSVAEKVLRKCPTPLLLLRVAGATAVQHEPSEPVLQTEGSES